jgi:ABC-type glycerol-3-phosphate transport system substrate-binding protein
MKASNSFLAGGIKRTALAALTFAMLALPLAGCGGGEGGDGGPIVVTFWHGMGGPLGRVLNEMVDDFNASQDRWFVESVGMGQYAALSQKIMASVAAQEPPVMAQVWTFPFNKSVRALYFNRDMFAASGLADDRPPRTQEEYLDFARRMTKDLDGDGRIDQWGTAGQVSAWQFENFFLQNGGRFFTEDGSRIAYNGPEGVKALQLIVNLTDEQRTGYVTSGFEYQNDFQAGKIGMVESSTVSLAYMKGKYDFRLGTAPIPVTGTPAMVVSGTNVAIFEGTPPEAQEGAWEFIKWFTSTHQTARWAVGTGYVPVRKSALTDPALTARFQEIWGLESVLGQLDYATFEPRTKEWFAGRKYLEEDAVEGAIRRRMTPQEALDHAAEKTQAEIARSR